MKRIALTLAALGVLGVAANRALAEGALSYPMAAHVAANYGIHHAGLTKAVQYQQVGRFSRRGYGHRGYRDYGHGGAAIHSRGCGCGHCGGGAVVVPYSRHYYPRSYDYYPRSYNYYPRPGFTYHGRGFSFGFGF